MIDILKCRLALSRTYIHSAITDEDFKILLNLIDYVEKLQKERYKDVPALLRKPA